MLSAVKTSWIFLRCAYYMAVICLYAITFSLVGKFNRQRADNILHWWGKKMVKVIRLTVNYHNPHQINFKDGKKYLLLSNHASLFDIPITYSVLNETIRMVAKIELSRIPIFGWALRVGEVPIIDRHNRQSAIDSLNGARKKMQDGVIIWMAPEGTRSKDGTLLPFKKGGFILGIQAEATVVPIVIAGVHKILPKHTWQFKTDQTVDIHLGKPIDASQYTIENKERLMEQVRKEMQSLLDSSTR